MNTNTAWLLILSGIGIFWFDLTVPLGVAVGLLYVLVTVIAYWQSDLTRCRIVAGICSTLIALGYLCTFSGDHDWGFLFNRVLSIVAVVCVPVVAQLANHGSLHFEPSASATSHDSRIDSFEIFELTPPTLQHFLENVRRSRVLSETVVDEMYETYSDLDPGAAVTRLVDEKRLTLFQASRIFHGNTGDLVFGDYVVQEKIGRGGVGVVYRAVSRGGTESFALKTLQREKMTERTIRRFQREIQATIALEHPNLVQSVASGEEQDVLYFVMELVIGKNLFNLVTDQRTIKPVTAIGYIVQAAHGLHYAHQQGIIHRDIKPSNLLVNAEGRVKILDLGLAKLIESDQFMLDTDLTLVGAICGSVDFMAPEQASSFHQADIRSDIYSLGCTLYFLLTGHSPLHGGSVEEKVKRLVTTSPSTCCEIPRSIPAPLKAVLTKMLQFAPERRYDSMDTVAQALEQLLPADGR